MPSLAGWKNDVTVLTSDTNATTLPQPNFFSIFFCLPVRVFWPVTQTISNVAIYLRRYHQSTAFRSTDERVVFQRRTLEVKASDRTSDWCFTPVQQFCAWELFSRVESLITSPFTGVFPLLTLDFFFSFDVSNTYNRLQPHL